MIRLLFSLFLWVQAAFTLASDRCPPSDRQVMGQANKKLEEIAFHWRTIFHGGSANWPKGPALEGNHERFRDVLENWPSSGRSKILINERAGAGKSTLVHIFREVMQAKKVPHLKL